MLALSRHFVNGNDLYSELKCGSVTFPLPSLIYVQHLITNVLGTCR
jgi:hypothetical protein